MQRGFSLIEVTVAVAILCILLAASTGFSLGAHPLGLRSAVQQFSSQVQSARSLAAASGNGATIVVQPRPAVDGSVASGFKSLLYGGRPNNPPLTISNAAAVVSDADIAEATAGAPAFAIFISSSGRVSIQGGFPTSAQFDTPNVNAIATEPPCPASGSYRITFAVNGATDSLQLACQMSVNGAPLP